MSEKVDSLITPSGNARGCGGNARNGVRDRGGVGHASGRAPRVAASVFCRQVSAVRSTSRQGWKSLFVHISENLSNGTGLILDVADAASIETFFEKEHCKGRC